jgi:hypothetical protein
VPSDEGEDMEEDDDGDDDEEKQIRILKETTGMPREAFDGNIFWEYWIVKYDNSIPNMEQSLVA